jgi:hypothetical protein
MKRSSGTQALLRSLFVAGTFVLGGCAGKVIIQEAPAPIAQAETETVTEEPDRVVVEGPSELAPPVATIETVEVVEPPPPPPHGAGIYIQIEGEYVRRHPHMRGAAVMNYNTGYVDGWAGSDFFNHGRSMSDFQVDRMIALGQRQGDPTGKLALIGYQEGYRAGAKHEPNPFDRRMTVEQATRLGRLRAAPGTIVVAPPEYRRMTPAEIESIRQARAARVEASKNRLETARNNRAAEEARLEAERKKLELARLEREKARKAELDAARDKRHARVDEMNDKREKQEAALKAKIEADKKQRELAAQQREQDRQQRELALKNKLEAEKKQRELEKQQRELALKNKLEADRKGREAEKERLELARKEREAKADSKLDAAKKQRETKKDQRVAEREKREAERKQKLAEKKAEREGKKTETADTAEQAH